MWCVSVTVSWGFKRERVLCPELKLTPSPGSLSPSWCFALWPGLPGAQRFPSLRLDASASQWFLCFSRVFTTDSASWVVALSTQGILPVCLNAVSAPESHTTLHSSPRLCICRNCPFGRRRHVVLDASPGFKWGLILLCEAIWKSLVFNVTFESIVLYDEVL